jgi:hypothetical protein
LTAVFDLGFAVFLLEISSNIFAVSGCSAT